LRLHDRPVRAVGAPNHLSVVRRPLPRIGTTSGLRKRSITHRVRSEQFGSVQFSSVQFSSVRSAGSGLLSAKLARNSTLKTYEGFPHGMPTSYAETSNADLLAFIRG